MYEPVNSNTVTLKENVRNLRMFDSLVVQLEHPGTTKFMKCPLYYGGELWNDLPAIPEISKILMNLKTLLNSVLRSFTQI